METGKITVTYDGDSYSYYFKDNGKAYTNEVRNNSAYGDLGVRVDASEGNSNEAKTIGKGELTNGLWIGGKYYTQGTIIVSSSGRIKKSGTVTIDGIKYEVTDSVVQKAYDKDDKNQTDNTDLYTRWVFKAKVKDENGEETWEVTTQDDKK